MVSFFGSLREGSDATLALREAREKVRSTLLQGQVSRAHPYFWAPFVYVGD
jgi:CHAT domain-containing protein